MISERNKKLVVLDTGKVQLRLDEGDVTVIAHRSPKCTKICNPEMQDRNPNHVLVELRDSETELESLLSDVKEEQIILKVDCEGSEREIFRSVSMKTLSKIHFILLGWHSEDILAEIRQTLEKLPFRLLVCGKTKDVGMLYAVS